MTNQTQNNQNQKPVLKLEILKHKDNIIRASLTGKVFLDNSEGSIKGFNTGEHWFSVGASGDGQSGLDACNKELNRWYKRAAEFQLCIINTQV